MTGWRRRGTVGFLLAGIGFVTASAVSFAVGRPLQILDVLMVVPLLPVLFGTMGLYAVQKDAFGRLGRLSAVVAPGFEWLALVGLPLT